MLCKKSIKNFAKFTENTTVLESLLKVQALDLTVTLSGGKSKFEGLKSQQVPENEHYCYITLTVISVKVFKKSGKNGKVRYNTL